MSRLMEEITDFNRRAFLGYDLYTKCVAAGGKIAKPVLEKRLKTIQKEGKLKGCTVENVAELCSFSTSKQEKFKGSVCSKDVQSSGGDEYLNKFNECPICLEVYDQNGIGTQELTPCGHDVHYSCFLKDLEAKSERLGRQLRPEDITCPLCNRQVTGFSGTPNVSKNALLGFVNSLQTALEEIEEVDVTGLEDREHHEMMGNLFDALQRQEQVVNRLSFKDLTKYAMNLFFGLWMIAAIIQVINPTEAEGIGNIENRLLNVLSFYLAKKGQEGVDWVFNGGFEAIEQERNRQAQLAPFEFRRE